MVLTQCKHKQDQRLGHWNIPSHFDDGEQSSDDSCFTDTDKEDDDLESQSASQNMAASDSGVESSSVSESTGRRSSSLSAVSILSIFKALTCLESDLC